MGWGYLMERIIVPTLTQLAIIGTNELLYYRSWEKPEWVVLSGTLIAAALMIGNLGLHLEYILVLPILISLFFFRKRLLYLAFAANLLTFFLMYYGFSEFRAIMTSYDLCIFFAIMIGILYIALQIIGQGKQMIADFMRMVTSEQDLVVKNAVMDRLAKIDALTDLYNHKTLHEYLEQLIEQSNNNVMPLQLAIMDIDNFKSVNDTYGHAVGDAVLSRVAQAVKDSLSQNEIIARYGGEEFVVIFPGKTLFEACQEMERTRELIYSIAHEEMKGNRISVSIGVAEHMTGKSSSALFEEADASLYYAKKHGKNQMVAKQHARKSSSSPV
ncbi:hypothetical protein J41TS12_48660 [Paenibacillus antibioticophila]|uniref:GGDEF domain-containing protein n=1 Tax=Paenibacillus antibioticophila TaxID=1274374 RepID=A0A919Y036_9BACL|nr:hypothetical protein J41TS12_48660 [Paenibacillus antibioticophila]